MNILIAGANGDIGMALGAELNRRGHRLFSLSRSSNSPPWSQQHLSVDCSTASSVDTVNHWLHQLDAPVDGVIQCAGILHNENHRPEKTLRDVDMDWLHKSMQVNLASHLHLAQALEAFIKRDRALRWVSVSARVASIGDNYLGGWYSYRMSKAALNMLVRNLSIEWARKSPESIAIAVHPGTTNSSLSEPFQKNIAPDKLYSAELTADRLANIVETMTTDMNGKLINWDGQPLPY